MKVFQFLFMILIFLSLTKCQLSILKKFYQWIYNCYHKRILFLKALTSISLCINFYIWLIEYNTFVNTYFINKGYFLLFINPNRHIALQYIISNHKRFSFKLPIHIHIKLNHHTPNWNPKNLSIKHN